MAIAQFDFNNTTTHNNNNMPSSSAAPGPTAPLSAPTSAMASPAAAVNPRPCSNDFQHAPTPTTLAWLAVSLPLVAWDTAYVLGRPHTMEGGVLHWPLWVPYTLYGTVDHVYGWKAFNANNGFTGAQGLLNLVETVMYVTYLWLYFVWGTTATTIGGTGANKTIGGRVGAVAVLVGFSAAVMTLSKTVLYCECHESCMHRRVHFAH
jgi:hypothetical protein